MSNFNESEHPRANDGKFTNKDTPAEEQRYNELYREKEKTPLEDMESLREQERRNNKPNKNKSFEQQVDKILDGTYKDQHIILNEETPKAFQDIGIPNKPILMTTKHAYLAISEKGKYNEKKNHYHNLGKELFLAIPKLLEKPTMILQNEQNIRNNEVLAILNWYDKDKNMLITPILIEGKGNKNFMRITANILKSVYGRENFKNYINNNYKQKDVLFAGNKKIRDANLKN